MAERKLNKKNAQSIVKLLALGAVTWTVGRAEAALNTLGRPSGMNHGELLEMQVLFNLL